MAGILFNVNNHSVQDLQKLTFFIDSKTVSNVNGTIPKSWLFPGEFAVTITVLYFWIHSILLTKLYVKYK